MSVLIDGCAVDVHAVLALDYVLEQCKFKGWRIVCTGTNADGSREIEALDAEGGLHNITVKN